MSYYEVVNKINKIAHESGRNINDVELIVVSKNQTIEAVESVYEAGCRQFGENRIQEFWEKCNLLPKEINWHFIGTLQKNKVSKAIGKFKLIHSVDHLALAEKISDTSIKMGIKTPILLQVNTSGEGSKHGLPGNEWKPLIKLLDKFPGIELCGLMTMAPFIDDESIIRKCFADLRMYRDQFRQLVSNPEQFRHLSMGMSQDYPIAIQEGATLLRIGSAVFTR